MQPDFNHSENINSNRYSWPLYLGASVLFHLLLIAAVIFFPSDSASRYDFSDRNVIEVDLAAIGPSTPLPPEKDKSASSESSPKPVKADKDDFKAGQKNDKQAEDRAVPVKKGHEKRIDPSDYVVEKPGPEIKHSMKKRTMRTEEVHKSIVEQIKERSGKSRPRTIKDRIKALEKEVSGSSRKLSDRLANIPENSGGQFPRDMSQIEVYQAEVAVELKNNWVFSERLAGNASGLETRIVIKIMPDGSVTDIWYEKRSGNSYLDQSAYKTVMKSDPLPPLPEGYPYYHLMLGFTPSGLRSR